MDTGDGMDDSGMPSEFEYIDGVMKAEMIQAEEGAEVKITLEITLCMILTITLMQWIPGSNLGKRRENGVEVSYTHQRKAAKTR